MGTTRWDDGDWDAYSSKTSTKTRSQIFTKRNLDESVDPSKFSLRESRDSDANPNSTPIIIGVDVTGSMGVLAERIVRTGVATLFEEILDRKPVSDPHLMTMAIGDAVMHDQAPLQVTQFEGDIKAVEWLEKIYIEGGGGGNSRESYDLPYYFAAYHTSTDAFEKRGKKGFIFTMGDERPPTMILKESIDQYLQETVIEDDISFKEVLEAAQKMYHCFHIIVPGWYADHHEEVVTKEWNELLGQNAIWLDDHDALGETIVSIIQVVSGEDKEVVSSSWNGDTSLVVANAIKHVAASPDEAFEAANAVILK